MTHVTDSKVIVALDYNTVAAAERFVADVSPDLCKLKVGKELFTRSGPQFVTTLVNRGFDVFLDLKFHDIPTTVAPIRYQYGVDSSDRINQFLCRRSL